MTPEEMDEMNRRGNEQRKHLRQVNEDYESFRQQSAETFFDATELNTALQSGKITSKKIAHGLGISTVGMSDKQISELLEKKLNLIQIQLLQFTLGDLAAQTAFLDNAKRGALEEIAANN